MGKNHFFFKESTGTLKGGGVSPKKNDAVHAKRVKKRMVQ